MYGKNTGRAFMSRKNRRILKMPPPPVGGQQIEILRYDGE
jgi:hypothetical protein